MNKITLSEFASLLQRNIRDFERFWRMPQERGNQHFPRELLLSEWEEQFEIFLEEMKDKNK